MYNFLKVKNIIFKFCKHTNFVCMLHTLFKTRESVNKYIFTLLKFKVLAGKVFTVALSKSLVSYRGFFFFFVKCSSSLCQVFVKSSSSLRQVENPSSCLQFRKAPANIEAIPGFYYPPVQWCNSKSLTRSIL